MNDFTMLEKIIISLVFAVIVGILITALGDSHWTEMFRK